MATKSSAHPLKVVLKLPHKVAEFLIAAQAIHDKMAADPKTYPSPTPTLAVLASHIADLVTQEAATKSRTVGAVATRNAAQKVVANDLNSERAYVEGLVNADPENAVTIAANAGMSLRKAPVRSKSDLATKKGAVSGTVHLSAKATKGVRANEWQYSLDGGKSWIDLPSTTKAQTSVPNLTPGTTVWFRQRPITKTGLPDWGQPVSTLVT
jgi:hypothetical protein